MLPFHVIKNFNILKAGDLHVGMRCVLHAMDTLVLKTVKSTFSEDVTSAVTLGAQRVRNTELIELFLKRIAGVLTSTIRNDLLTLSRDCPTWQWQKPTSFASHAGGNLVNYVHKKHSRYPNCITWNGCYPKLFWHRIHVGQSPVGVDKCVF